MNASSAVHERKPVLWVHKVGTDMKVLHRDDSGQATSTGRLHSQATSAID
jgi:hypothetical protein